ncbi:hypothetical protein IFM12275_54750 [Nocardia sputorum]|uniref:Uncharacterized protein n=1 Tax=Nocardia sputorum TaxID=2984338 RepID=A0ABN6TWG9_9NOCA|nr:hypothetical protein IFM12275_54750 [Nocardia sputorum]BDT97252.1 hypothetical protein IFM12276_02810 [Nocardia sputorum]
MNAHNPAAVAAVVETGMPAILGTRSVTGAPRSITRRGEYRWKRYGRSRNHGIRIATRHRVFRADA